MGVLATDRKVWCLVNIHYLFYRWTLYDNHDELDLLWFFTDKDVCFSNHCLDRGYNEINEGGISP